MAPENNVRPPGYHNKLRVNILTYLYFISGCDNMDVDWNRCIICQQDTCKPLKCPLQTPGSSGDNTDAYTSLLTIVKQLQDIDALPTNIYFGSEDSASDFASHCAAWHKSCHLKYNNSKLAKAKKRSLHNIDEAEKRSSKRQSMDIQNCFFCEEGYEEGDLHQVLTFDADINMRSMITELQDTKLLARIVGGDLIAMEAKYHLKCLVNLRNCYRSHTRKLNQDPANANDKVTESRVFVELTSYIEKAVKSGMLLFKLSEIHSLYVNRLDDLGINKEVNKTRLKDHLLEHFPEAQEQYDGRSTVIIFKGGMQNMLKETTKCATKCSDGE